MERNQSAPLNELDAEFSELLDVLIRRANGKSEFPDLSVDNHADRLFDIAFQLGDRDMLQWCFVVFSIFVEQGTVPPWPMMEHIKDAFRRFESCKELDDAFCLKTGKRGKPVRFNKRMHDDTIRKAYRGLRLRNSKTKTLKILEDLFDIPDIRFKVKGMK